MTACSEFPWYDSLWLKAYTQTKSILSKRSPTASTEFVDAMNVFRVSPIFNETQVNSILSEPLLERVRTIISNVDPALYEKHEFLRFGRLVIHDLPEFSTMQQELTSLVEQAVGEPVEASYNFLSLYNNLGKCDLHMDAPYAKWTLDTCINQSALWPIYFSDVVPWPENFTPEDDWQSKIIASPERKFREYTLEPNQAVIFAGSSQWHYRKRIEQHFKQNFCHLLFMHFIPLGTNELVNPKNWAKLFSAPELNGIDDVVSRLSPDQALQPQ
jgi:hypothetical protein